MARRSSSAADGIIKLVSAMPWWVGIALAVLLYLVLHKVASRPVAPATGVAGAGAMAVQTMWVTLAGILQYLLPLLCLVGAASSAWRRREARQLASKVTANPGADALDGMTWQQFERLVSESFRRQGWQVRETGGGGADGGVDLVLLRGTEKHLVQCKQWRAFKVGVDVVRELYGVMAATGAAGGVVVSSGAFTTDASKFAQGRNIRLITGAELRAMLAPAAGGLAQRTSPLVPALAESPREQTSSPACPACGGAMVKRVARKGANAGNAFWGCASYPACRGTKAVG